MSEASTLQAASGATPADVVRVVERCAAVLKDAAKLRPELDTLHQLEGPLPTFAAALFELECARAGDAKAKAAMADTAETLLGFFNQKASSDELATAHPALGTLWEDASTLLISFQVKRFVAALAACWEARTDAALLRERIDQLQPEGHRRVEFARCLYHLSLARLAVDSSRLEFARRIELVREAYLEPQTAEELIGEDEGLAHLWQDLVPYLDEFFEAQEQEEERALRAAGGTDPAQPSVPIRAPLVTPMARPAGSSERAPPAFSELMPKATALAPVLTNEPVTPVELGSDPTPLSLTAPIAPSAPVEEEFEVVTDFTPRPGPPPPPDTTPRPAPPPPHFDDDDDGIEIISVSPAPSAPRRSVSGELDVLSDYEPTPEAQVFWRHTETSLGLLPDPKQPRVGQRVLSADDRGARKKLNAWLESVQGRFDDQPDSVAMQCLLKLYMAAQIKEKTLFGGVNPKRVEAFRDALRLLTGDAAAAGRCAVWFELDGHETLEYLQSALEVVADYLQFCAREGCSPLDEQSPQRFLEVP